MNPFHLLFEVSCFVLNTCSGNISHFFSFIRCSRLYFDINYIHSHMWYLYSCLHVCVCTYILFTFYYFLFYFKLLILHYNPFAFSTLFRPHVCYRQLFRLFVFMLYLKGVSKIVFHLITWCQCQNWRFRSQIPYQWSQY